MRVVVGAFANFSGTVQEVKPDKQKLTVMVSIFGRPTLVDGPYAEAKEFIGGYFLLDCATRDQALEIAARCPAAEWCSVEVRRVAPCWEPDA